MTIKLEILDTPEKIARLIQYKDHKLESIIETDYGSFIQWLQANAVSNNNIRIFAATENNRIIGYLIGVLCITLPLYSYLTAIHFTTIKTEASYILRDAFENWGRENGATRAHIETLNPASVRLYETKGKYKKIGWVLSKEL